MQQSFVVQRGFEGVADGVAEVEQHALAGFVLIALDDSGFDADGCGDDFF